MALLTGIVWGIFLTLAVQGCRGADYEITVRSVYDGDTLVADIDLPAQQFRALGRTMKVAVTLQGERIRLAGINAPELYTAEGKKARAELAAWLPSGTRGILRTSGRELEKYGRAFGRIEIAGADLSARLIAAGLAVRWNGKGARP